MSRAHPQPWIKRSLILGGAVFAAFAIWLGYSVWSFYDAAEEIEYVGFDPSATRDALAASREASAVGNDPDPETLTESVPPPVSTPDDVFRSFLIIGNDNRPGFGGNRADVILVVLMPGDGAPPVLFSLPRDLYVTNPCTGSQARINTLLAGCEGAATGPELLAVGVEDFTGVPIDHFVLLDFGGFERVIDVFGGVEICLEYPIRDAKVNYDGTILPAGCSIATGAQALAWVRSRNTQEFVAGVGWKTQQGVNDLVRNERQQEMLFALMSRAASLRSIASLREVAESVAGAVILSDNLSLTSGVSLAWDMRSVDLEEVIRLTVPVRPFTTESGSSVLLPVGSFSALLEETLATASPGDQSV